MENIDYNSPEVLRDLLQKIDAASPNMRALVYPKSYRLPPGYSSPKQFMVSAFSALNWLMKGNVYVDDERNIGDATMAGVWVQTTMLARYQMPTFFVGQELCEALLETQAPEDLRFDEIQMPMPVMLFMLHREFSLRYFGHTVPYLVAGVIPPNFCAESKLKYGDSMPPKIDVKNEDACFVCSMLSYEDGKPYHYDSRSPTFRQVKDLMHLNIKHYSYLPSTLPDKEHDNVTCGRMTNLGINILLAMTAEPEIVSREQMLRPARWVNGEIRDRALWEPNFVGRNFRIQYDRHSPQGSHRSPHAHWRIGHWRNQRHGPQNTLVKRIWIKPIFVGLSANGQQGSKTSSGNPDTPFPAAQPPCRIDPTP